MPRWRPTPLVHASVLLHAGSLGALGLAPALWPWVLGGLAANHLALTLASMSPRSQLLGANLSRLPEGCRRAGQVALTFDDGPDPETTPRVLDLLDAHQARASFFLIGRRAARHPALVREILRRGHSAENHSNSHPLHFAALGPGGQRREVLRAQAAILEAGGAPRFFRPPVGLHSPFLAPVLAGTGLRHASWTRRGADGVIGDPARVLHRLHRADAGDILLLHDGNSRPDDGGRPVVLAVLPALLTRLVAAGFSLVPLPEAVDGHAAPAAAAAAQKTPAPAARACR
ncbi:polysaccharide deacetylase family protein [Roseomonas sp. M0104]|uniref:Chitooligosaccharide deacetylase n=1 Tax=Teichococcus coralli TaxID=2545983 RepID=A0A845BLD7_9PROT|nr:polysaccharide deacetylase family protein [Pseudoroseomonas coralli]